MESWSYASEGKSFAVSDEAVSDNSFSRSRNMLMAWEPKYPSCSYGNNNMLLVSSTQSVTGNQQGIGELEFPEMVIKELLDDDSIGDVFSTRSGGGSMSTLNASAKKGESSSKALLSSVVESNSSRDSLLIDLKLGRFADHRDAQSLKGSSTSNLSSAESSTTPAKRSRSTGFNAQIAYCQVHGCNKDLSGSKDYHKRHKVCDIHSKTAKVIVNGIEQRFCQQCSRFHLLGEFDDDKRSCRKRLAGHNERRRKPQVGVHPGTTARFLQSYNGLAGTRLYGTTLTAMSFICPEILPSGLVHPEKYETNDWCRRIKVEDGTDFNPPSAIPIINGHPHSKSVFSSYSLEKQYPHFHDNGASTASSGSVMSENNNLYHPHDSSGPNYGASSLFQNSSLGSKDLTVFDTASTVQGLSAISSTGCALSLLSSQTHNSSNHSSGIPMAQPLNIPGSHAHYSMSQVSERLLGVSSQPSMSGVSNKFRSSGMNSADGNDLNPILVSDGNSGVNFEDTYDGVFQGSDFANAKGHLSWENGATINLLQLSSQLQRVKRQRQSMPVKLENDAFCCLRIT